MSLAETQALALANQETIQAIQDNTVEPSDLTPTQRKAIEDVLFPIINGARVWKKDSPTTYSAFEVGDEILDIDDSNKRQVLGRIIGLPFTYPADIDDISKFDRYQDSKPAIS